MVEKEWESNLKDSFESAVGCKLCHEIEDVTLAELVV